MQKIINKKAITLMCAGIMLFSINGSAQQKKAKHKEVSVIKTGTSEEKMTIVIDGDKVTVNGSPVTTDFSATFPGRPAAISLSAPLAPIPPIPPFPPIAPEMPIDIEAWGDVDIAAAIEPMALLGVFSEKDEKGAKITDVVEGSPAQKAGLVKGDIITRVEDKTITDPASLSEAVRSFKPEQEVEITYLREKKKKKVKVTLGKQKESFSHNFRYEIPEFAEDFSRNFNFDKAFEWNAKPKLGIRIQDLEEGKGVKVLDVQDASAAEKSGILKDDVITSIDGKEIENADQARERIAEVKDKSSYPVKILRNGTAMDIQIKIPKKLKTTDL